MATDISMQTTNYQVGSKQWLLSPLTGINFKRNVTLDVTKFVAGTHYPNGFIPAGTVIGLVTATKLGGVYDNTTPATDGTQVAYGILAEDARVVQQNGATSAKVSTAVIVMDAAISVGKLPFQSGKGAIDAAAKTALNLIRWEA